MKNLTSQTKIALLFALAAIAFFAALFTYQAITDPEPADASERSSIVVRSDSHVLGDEADGDVTLVEFLDFECEACGAIYPLIEQLREVYAGEVTFVARYFPMPGHANGRAAAHAVESAARQGEHEQMYSRMFETQAEWGERQESQARVFRGFAEDIGLDMEQYDADVDSPEVAARVQKDVDDGLELGVSGTPTFYLDGEELTPTTTGEFIDALEAALGR